MYIPELEMAVQRWWSRWVRAGRSQRARPAADGAGFELVYTTRYRLTVSVFFAVFTALYEAGFLLLDIFKDEPDWKRWGLTAGSLLLWLLLAAVWIAALLERVTVTDELVTRRSWRGRQQLQWDLVRSMRIVEDAEALELKGRDDTGTVRISLFFDGLWALEPYLVRRFGTAISNTLQRVFPPRS